MQGMGGTELTELGLMPKVICIDWPVSLSCVMLQNCFIVMCDVAELLSWERTDYNLVRLLELTRVKLHTELTLQDACRTTCTMLTFCTVNTQVTRSLSLLATSRNSSGPPYCPPSCRLCCKAAGLEL